MQPKQKQKTTAMASTRHGAKPHDMRGWVSYLDKEEAPAAGTSREDSVAKLGASLNAQAVVSVKKAKTKVVLRVTGDIL